MVMPLFGSKFSPKRAPLRKNSSNNASGEALDDLVGAQHTIKLRLGEEELTFENGDWIPEGGPSGASRPNQKLRKKIQELQEENNMLRLKYAVMLNMLTQTTAESHLQVRELEKLRKRK